MSNLVPPEISSEYPNAVAHYRDGELIFTAEIVIGGVDDTGIYWLVQDGPAEGERVYVEE